MNDRRAKYKQKGQNFGNLELSRISRVEKQDQRRKEIRSRNFSRLRTLDEVANSQSPGKPVAQISRNEKLVKWKKQKEIKKKSEKRDVKPPFKVGIVHHKAFSPPIHNNPAPSCSHWNSNSQTKSKNQQLATPLKGITRVTERRLAAKAAKAAAAAKKSFAPPNHKFKPPTGLTNIPLFGRVKKGSMDISKLSFGLSDRNSPLKSAIKNSIANQRKKSNSLSLSSPRKSNKPKISFSESVKKSPKNKKKRRSSSRYQLPSNSSIDSLSLPALSDDTEVFDSEIEEPNEVETQSNESPIKESVTTLTQPLETLISSNQSNDDLQLEFITSPNKIPSNSSQIELEHDSVNYSLKLQVTDLSDRIVNSPLKSFESNCFENNTLKLQVTDLSDQGVSFKANEQNNSQDYSLKWQPTDLLEDMNSSKTIETVSELLETESEKNNLSSEISNKSFNDTLNVALFSPYVVTRRGKKEARKEQKVRRGFNRSPEEIPTKETVMQNLNISIDEEKRTAQYFRCLLESETTRLGDLCDRWNDILQKENPNEEAVAIVEQAIGQTRLLLRSKFKQFEGLVRQCEECNQEQLVTCKDLQGFWDMMSVTVKNCEGRFENVEKLKANDWIEDVKVVAVRKRLPSKKKSPKKSPSKKAPAKSNLRAMIMAARQKKKEMETNLEEKPNDEQVMEIWKNVVKESPTKEITTKRRLSIAPPNSTPKERRMSFAKAAMIISQKRKTPENLDLPAPLPVMQTQDEVENEVDIEMETLSLQVHLDESISYINSNQTPGKSILKRVKVEPDTDFANDSRILKSTQKVNFNDNVELKEVEVDEETKNKKSLAAALARIDSMNFEDEYVPEVNIRAEKRLNFEDMSFNENVVSNDDVFEEVNREDEKTLEFNINATTPKSNESKKEFSDFEFSSEEKRSTRSTRNRKANFDSQITSEEKIEENKITPKSPRLIRKNKLNSDSGNSSASETTERKIVPKSPRFTKKSKLNSDLEDSTASETTEKKIASKSPRFTKKSKLNSDLENSLINENTEKKILPKSPRFIKKSKLNSDLEVSSASETTERKIVPKSPRFTKKGKLNSDLENSPMEETTEKNVPKSPSSSKKSKQNTDVNLLMVEEIHEEIIEEDDTFRRSLRSRTIIGNLTPKSAKKLNKGSPLSAKRVKSPFLDDTDVKLNSENSNNLLLERNNSLRSSKRLIRSPMLILKPHKKPKILTPSQEEETIHQAEEETKIASSSESRRRTPRRKEETKESGKKATPKLNKESESPVEKLAKMTKNSVSLFCKLIKTPLSAAKKAKIITDATENMETDSESRPQSSKCKKMRKTPKVGQMDEENENKDSMYKQKMQLNDSLNNSLISLTKSPRSTRKNLRKANKLTDMESMETENSTPNVMTENVSMKSNLKKKVSTEFSLSERNMNSQESLNLSLAEIKTPKINFAGRSLKIPADEMLSEKENASPGIFKNKTLINSPKPIETPSKRKSIKRSMSCHVAECQVGFTSTPQLQRSNSGRLSKASSNRKSINPVTSASP